MGKAGVIMFFLAVLVVAFIMSRLWKTPILSRAERKCTRAVW